MLASQTVCGDVPLCAPTKGSETPKMRRPDLLRFIKSAQMFEDLRA